MSREEYIHIRNLFKNDIISFFYNYFAQYTTVYCGPEMFLPIFNKWLAKENLNFQHILLAIDHSFCPIFTFNKDGTIAQIT